MCFKTAVLDWNGTLLNDLPLVYQSVCRIFRFFDLPAPTLTQYRTEISHNWRKFYTDHGIPESVTADDLNALRSEYFNSHWHDVALHPYALILLQFLKNRNIKTLLVTGEVPDLVRRRLAQFRIEDFFDDCVAGVHNKPQTLRELKLVPQETFYVDDDPHALCGVKELGFFTIGMTHGYASSKRIRSVKPNFMSSDFSGVIGFLAEKCEAPV